MEAPTCCQRAPPCVRAPPRPTPDWAFWHLCVCTLHSTQPPGAGPGCKTGPGAGTCASSAHYKSCHSGREAPDPRGWGFRVGLFRGLVQFPSLGEGCVQTSWTTPPLAQAFQLLSIHRGQILKLQQDTSSTCTHPPPTNNPSLFKFSPSHPKNQPQGFVRIFRVRGELRNAKCIPLPRSKRGSKIALFQVARPHTPRGKKVRMLAN